MLFVDHCVIDKVHLITTKKTVVTHSDSLFMTGTYVQMEHILWGLRLSVRPVSQEASAHQYQKVPLFANKDTSVKEMQRSASCVRLANNALIQLVSALKIFQDENIKVHVGLLYQTTLVYRILSSFCTYSSWILSSWVLLAFWLDTLSSMQKRFPVQRRFNHRQSTWRLVEHTCAIWI